MFMELMHLLQHQLLRISKASFKNKRQIRKFLIKSSLPFIIRKVKITRATFCMYDIIMRRDVRVEIAIPGGTHVFAIDEHQ